MQVAMQRKRTKYLERCEEVGLNFMALAFDTLGAVHPEAKEFLNVMFKDAMSRQLLHRASRSYLCRLTWHGRF